MSLELFLLYAGAVVVLCLTPGPNSLLALANGAQYGVRGAIFSTLGCASGLFVLIAACLAGLGVLLAASETAFVILKTVGCLYLVWIGISLMRGQSSLANPGTSNTALRRRSPRQLYWQGFLVVATNPKVLLFFSAFLPQFYSTDGGFWSQLLLLAGTFVVIEVCLEICLALFAERIWGYIRSPRRRRYVNGGIGALFVSAGVLLLAAERPK